MTPDRPAGSRSHAHRHIPVLLAEVMEALAPAAGERFIDATFGAGGYSTAILDRADCTVLALDRDPGAVRGADRFTPRYRDRLTVVEAPFSRMAEAARDYFDRDGESRPQQVDGVVLDIGVSSMQLDDPVRGFSFQADGPLDMRMAAEGPTAADFVNTADEATIADVIYALGEERRSRAIARAITARRTAQPFIRTLDLADLVARVVGRRHDDPRHPATRTFQALRIHVNDELGELAHGLAAAELVLRPGGRLVVVTFHSLEDRIVKQFLGPRSGRERQASRHLPARSIKFEAPSFRLVNRRPLTPSKGEQEANPRARSARLRAAIRTAAPAWPADPD
jgi:16S rRNA (cytosine1402-N4)-methyltransferase